MRARNIKPGFFKNEELADLGPCAQLLFVGLWQLADREGRLEDRPRRIKIEIFPYYDPKPSLETLLDRLVAANLICRYEVEKLKLISITNFLKHQTPHHTEKKSNLPAPYKTNSEPTVNPPLSPGENPPDSLNPDSLNPDSLNNPPTPFKKGDGFNPQKLALLWNKNAPPEMSKVNLPFKRSPNAMEKIKGALKRNPDPEWWTAVIQRMFHSPFLRGEKGWKANIDFMVRKAEEIVDGKYDGPGTTPAAGTLVVKLTDPDCTYCKGSGFEMIEKEGERLNKICRCRK